MIIFLLFYRNLYLYCICTSVETHYPIVSADTQERSYWPDGNDSKTKEVSQTLKRRRNANLAYIALKMIAKADFISSKTVLGNTG